ncbi:MAG: hypothetical protein ACI9WU_001926 [Myxococcota bacterium]|jgi:hypothetical protein
MNVNTREFGLGRLVVNFQMSLGVLNGGHAVQEAQRTEPGVAVADQPHGHELVAIPMAWTLASSFGLSDRLAVDVTLPVHASVIDAGFTDLNHGTIGGFDSIHHRDETVAGIGDLRIGLVVGGVLDSELGGFRLTGRVGLSLPTGAVEDDPFVLGENGQHHQHTFFGSGTFMPELRLDVSYSWTDVSLLGWVDTRLSLYEGPKSYRPSSVVSGGVGVGSGFGLDRWMFSLGQEVFHEKAAKWSGTPAENSGRTQLLLALAVHWQVEDSWSLSFTAKTPYLTWTEGEPFDFPFLGVLGVSWGANLMRQSEE